MKKLRYIFPLLLLFAVVGQGCKEELRLDHIDENAPAPQQVSNIKSEGIPGGAILTYTVPSDANLSYVKAVYEIQPGVFKEGKASFYTDTIRLEGFGDTNEYDVKVYTVGKNDKASEPLTIKVKPLTPPVQSAFKYLTLDSGFGGVKIKFQNEFQANLAIVLEADTAGNGVMIPLQTYYTKAREGSYSYRGLAPIRKTFTVYLRDRWGNKSEILTKRTTPLAEAMVPKPFTALQLPTDEYLPVEAAYPMSRMWDGLVDIWIFASRNSTVVPQWFTVDLNRPVIVSRMKVHQRSPNYTYGGGNVKRFELYGSSAPNPNGSWDSWKLLGSFTSTKPSGLPLGQNSAEDYNYGHTLGEDFELTETPLAYRYYRFKSLETYGGGGQITIAEISFWGKF
ncbi:DUF5000 domain-containing lipoprotein [Pedobacter metabolipauper]|uniref:Uncharacterized protein DUF5126 n=1 Tax=Pedobacter metabolipauper TaxID=425513 RepID=A0A4R6STK1_9SPHI|nr:DUF5000 domain-containing lipoprotein [Pedobacter metabolipauper]TDQ08785.1 uncharacterized protein DUF5126 [Pedobacter metabolipauper]